MDIQNAIDLLKECGFEVKVKQREYNGETCKDKIILEVYEKQNES